MSEGKKTALKKDTKTKVSVSEPVVKGLPYNDYDEKNPVESK